MTTASTIATRFKFSQRGIDALPPHPRDARSTEAEYSNTEVAGLTLLARLPLFEPRRDVSH